MLEGNNSQMPQEMSETALAATNRALRSSHDAGPRLGQGEEYTEAGDAAFEEMCRQIRTIAQDARVAADRAMDADGLDCARAHEATARLHDTARSRHHEAAQYHFQAGPYGSIQREAFDRHTTAITAHNAARLEHNRAGRAIRSQLKAKDGQE